MSIPNKRNYCSSCNKQFSTGSAYSNHIKSKNHLLKLLESQSFKEAKQVLENSTNFLDTINKYNNNKCNEKYDNEECNEEYNNEEYNDEEYNDEEYDDEEYDYEEYGEEYNNEQYDDDKYDDDEQANKFFYLKNI